MRTIFIIALAALTSAAAHAQPLTLVPAQDLYATKLTATGRVQSLLSARIGPRVSGYLAELGTDKDGRPLDAGMRVDVGAVLFKLDETTFRNQLAAAEAMLHSARSALANLTAPPRDERVEQLQNVINELDARLSDRKRDEERYRRLVEQERTLPAKRLEEVLTEVATLKFQRAVAESRLREAKNGPTKTEIALAEAKVKEAEAAVKSAKDDLRDATIRAPYAGMITRRFKSPGDYLANVPPTEVIELVASDKLELELRLPEAYLNSVETEKTRVVLHTPLLKQALPLTVSRVVREIDPAKGTFAVRIVIPQDRAGLAPGAFISAEVELTGQRSDVIVPQRAVLLENGKSIIYIAKDGKMARREVEVGDRLTEGVLIRSGLSTGDTVIVGPAAAMKDGAALPAQ